MRYAKAAIFLGSLVPLAWLIWGLKHDQLGGNPVEYMTHSTGDWALRFLLLTLLITPLRKLTGQQYLLRFRRMLGLFAFFYVCLHFLIYLKLDQNFDLTEIGKDIYKRPFITVGFVGFLSLLPLAITSTKGMIRRLGGKNWQRLHRLIYIGSAAGVVHYYWLVKSDVRKPVIYGAMLAILLVSRVTLVPALAHYRATH